MSEEKVPPELPGEVWAFDDRSGAVTVERGFAKAWYWSDGRKWVEASRVMGVLILGEWGLFERDRAEKAEREAAGALDVLEMWREQALTATAKVRDLEATLADFRAVERGKTT